MNWRQDRPFGSHCLECVFCYRKFVEQMGVVASNEKRSMMLNKSEVIVDWSADVNL